jgi:DNA-binding MarR family transcriptional regulator
MPADQRIDQLAAELHRVLSNVCRVLGRRDANAAAAGDLTPAQLSILLTLWEHGPMRMTDLAAHERVRIPTATVAIHRLETTELVTRYSYPGDKRSVLVGITPRGHATRRKSLAARHAQLAAMLNELNADEQATLLEALAPLERIADQGTS